MRVKSSVKCDNKKAAKMNNRQNAKSNNVLFVKYVTFN